MQRGPYSYSVYECDSPLLVNSRLFLPVTVSTIPTGPCNAGIKLGLIQTLYQRVLVSAESSRACSVSVSTAGIVYTLE